MRALLSNDFWCCHVKEVSSGQERKQDVIISAGNDCRAEVISGTLWCGIKKKQA